jgi:protein TonB
MFEQNLVSEGKTNISWTVLVAFGGELVLVTTLVLIPLIYLQALPRAQLNNAVFLAPTPPPPPRSPQAALPRVAKVIPRQFVVGHLTAPVTVPKQVANLKEQEFAPPSEATGLAGGVPGGVPGGQIGGVIGGIVGSIPSAGPPPPPSSPVQNELKAATPQRIRLGGNLQAANLLHQVTPAYPVLAKAGRVQGTVRLNAVIGKDGMVREITLISGHPLLVQAAMQAARQFIYRPTYLNGQAVEVDTVIDVQFHLT